MQKESPDSQNKKESKSKAIKIAGIASTVMWVVSFILLFALDPEKDPIWTSDALLLAGFWPLLYVYKAGWTWLTFGLLNMGIGFFLEVARFLPVEAFPPDVIPTKDHVLSMHPSMPWLLNGFVSALFGIFRILRTIYRWTKRKLSKS